MKHITSLSIALVAFWTLPGAQAISPPADPPAKPAAASTSAGTAKQKEDSVRELDWEELLPKTQGGNFTLDAPPQPPPNHYLDESGPGATQYGSAEVNKDLNGVRVKIPGYIVPLQITGTGRVLEFLLVPYFGACIHVPPPPPNQIVYVRMKQGIDLNSVYDAHWITGRLKTAVFESKMASAAYSLEGEKDELYKY
jgi:hypothetical protein